MTDESTAAAPDTAPVTQAPLPPVPDPPATAAPADVSPADGDPQPEPDPVDTPAPLPAAPAVLDSADHARIEMALREVLINQGVEESTISRELILAADEGAKAYKAAAEVLGISWTDAQADAANNSPSANVTVDEILKGLEKQYTPPTDAPVT